MEGEIKNVNKQTGGAKERENGREVYGGEEGCGK